MIGCRVLYFGLLLLHVHGELKWDIGDQSGCAYIFGQSVRERARQLQQDPLLIWLGMPSETLQVASKHGRLPIVSLWRSYVNVLYVTKCEGGENDQPENIGYFVNEWMAIKPAYKNRSLYICGRDRLISNGSTSLMAAVLSSIAARGLHVGGVFIGKPAVTPSVRFFGHRPFETGNKLNSYALSRALNPVSCNAWFSQVEFVLHDVIFYYTPEAFKHGDNKEMYEYQLTSVSTYDTCYADIKAFEADWMHRSPNLDSVMPALPQHTSLEVFPECDSTKIPADYGEILANNITVYMYSFIRKESSPICSFYIGIFESDGLRYPRTIDQSANKAIFSFNSASTDNIEDSWTRYTDEHTFNDRDSYSQLGQIQDAASVWTQEHSQRLVWMHLDSRMDLKSKAGLLMLSKYTAVDILSRLMNRDVNVEFVDLFV